MPSIVIANWKSKPETVAEAQALAREIARIKIGGVSGAVVVAVCPRGEHLAAVAKELTGSTVLLGAQDLLANGPGKEFVLLGGRYVIVGHSDRRWGLGESDETVNQKLKAALAAGLTPIVCLGECRREGDWREFLKKQTLATFAGVDPAGIKQCLIAYEPVWAISATPGARADTPAGAAEAVGVIRGCLEEAETPGPAGVLYGGSVNGTNAKSFLSHPAFGGVLVGKASLDAKEFALIIAATS